MIDLGVTEELRSWLDIDMASEVNRSIYIQSSGCEFKMHRMRMEKAIVTITSEKRVNELFCHTEVVETSVL